MIDWKKVANMNGLTPEEFEKEMFTVACCLGAMRIDNSDERGAIRFACADEVGKLEMIVRRTS